MRAAAAWLVIACLSLSAAPGAVADDAFEWFGGLRLDERVPSPREVIGHEVGERFTRHHLVGDYMRALADASDRASLVEYGRTHQRRPLYALTITSPANLARLEEILERNRALADPRNTSDARASRIIEDNPAIVWLSYNVHGNEASCTEAALRVAYTLVAGTNPEIDTLLDDIVVVIDPCLNPDGRERYVSFFDNHVGAQPNANPDGAEHHEPWAWGRVNHYLFDLNRDWVWGVHPESRTRMALYRRYLPHFHADFHEQGIHSPYFMGAGDTPYNLNIPQESKDWFDRYGRASAEAFDRFGLPYATKESFDYLYPGYGKVTPVYHGAVSLLCEQAGHGFAGLAVDVDDEHGPGLTLTLRDRARNHFIASMAYLEETARSRREQLERFRRFFVDSMDAPTTSAGERIGAFAFLPGTDPAAMRDLWELCALHGIEVRRVTSTARVGGATRFFPPYGAGEEAELPAGTLLVRLDQPLSRLALTLFERDAAVEDPDTYDITSWTTPVMFGLDALEIRGSIEGIQSEPVESWPAASAESASAPGRVATIVPAGTGDFPLVLAEAARLNLFARLLDDSVVVREQPRTVAPRGSLLVHTIRNNPSDLAAFLASMRERGIVTHAMDFGYPVEGPALGNDANVRLITPRIALVRGGGISSLSFGHTWHMLDLRWPTPHTVVHGEEIGEIDWDRYNVLVLPSARSLASIFDDEGVEALKGWVRKGGSVVAIGSSSEWASEKLLGLDEDENVGRDDEDDGEGEEESDERDDGDEELFRLSWEERRQRAVEDRVPGALLAAEVDLTHPLGAGLRDRVGFHVFSGEPLPVADDGHVVARFVSSDARIGGSISQENLDALAGTPAVTHHRLGGGSVICFASDPTNRGMNRAGMRLLMNAILLAPSNSSALQPLGDDAHEH